MERRIRALEALYRPANAIPLEYLVQSLPPMSARVAERHTRFIADVEEHGLPPLVPTDPQRGVTDDDLAEWVMRTFPHEMPMSADACAGLLVEAHWRRDADQHGPARAWPRQRNRRAIAARMAGRFTV